MTSIFSCLTRSISPSWIRRSIDFAFDIWPSDYRGDGSRFLKLAFGGIGEIDFIVGSALTTPSVTQQTVQGEQVDLETVAEIITKKIHYRGASIRPRDMFDVAAAAKSHRDSVVEALRQYKDDVAGTLAAIERLRPDFVNAAILELMIKDKFKPLAATALDDTLKLLRSV